MNVLYLAFWLLTYLSRSALERWAAVGGGVASEDHSFSLYPTALFVFLRVEVGVLAYEKPTED